MNKKFTQIELNEVLQKINPGLTQFSDYLFEIYSFTFDGISELQSSNQLNTSFTVDSLEIVYFMAGEFIYSTAGFNEEHLKSFLANEKLKESMCDVIADKYISLSVYNHREEKLTNSYFPPISSIELYLNLMGNILNQYQRNDPQHTLILDLLNKSVSISRCIIKLLCDGYETEALAMWRTLHESECILILLDKYGDSAINAYLKHMQYGIIYRKNDKENPKDQEIFARLKAEMAEHDLKSKDTKKFIEYGWLYAIEDYKKIDDFKLNFRDGIEKLADLHQYSDIYTTSSEILHSTPLLIYSNKRYFYYTSLLNLYESFFRIEKVFTSLFFSRFGEEAKERYLQMRRLYYSQLVNIHQREVMNFKKGH